MTSATALSARIRRPEGVQRLGQALWMMVGERLSSPGELLWASSLLGAGGERLLWDALVDSGCLGSGNRLLARPLATFLCALWESPDEAEPSLLWTLPHGLHVPGIAATGYVEGVRELIRGARVRLTLLAPYVAAEGVGQLQSELLAAVSRGVTAVVITQDANTLGSWASDSLELLRREARGLSGALSAYTAPVAAPVLLHSKLVAADAMVAIVGSANLTGSALLRNLETGVIVGAPQALEIERVVQAAIELGHLRLVFST